MNYKGDRFFKNFFVPRDFFAVPSDKTITKIEIYIQRKIFTGGSSRITYWYCGGTRLRLNRV